MSERRAAGEVILMVCLIAILFVLAMVIVKSLPPAQPPVSTWHDDALGVTCWLVYDQGISCLPDNQIGQ